MPAVVAGGGGAGLSLSVRGGVGLGADPLVCVPCLALNLVHIIATRYFALSCFFTELGDVFI